MNTHVSGLTLGRLRSTRGTNPLLSLTLLLGLCVACDPLGSPGDLIQPAGPGDDPTLDGPFAVGLHASVPVGRWILSDFKLDVYYPAEEAAERVGEFASLAAPAPVVVLVPDVGIAREQYEWLGARLASWGLVTLVPNLPLTLPQLAFTRPSASLDRVAHSMEQESFWKGQLDLTAVAVGGQGGGAGLADLTATVDTRVTATFLLQGAPWISPGGREGPVLLIGAMDDCAGNAEALETAYSAYVSPKDFASIDGLSRELATLDIEPSSSCPASVSRALVHGRLSAVLVPWLRFTLLNDPLAEDWMQTPPGGIDWEGGSVRVQAEP